MRSAVEAAVDTYIRAWSERDPEARARMLEACFAVDGRIVERHQTTLGRAALAALVERFLDDPQWARVRVTSAIDAVGTTFRFRAAIDRHDGTTLELFDAGEVDAAGRIRLILTFVDPLGAAPPSVR